ncbi:hypothetical protein CRUP_028942 [Coryphaenoides rupestris]|nr:hypothetical protein CRUP_028942 [Coryphaenoides rupestris]
MGFVNTVLYVMLIRYVVVEVVVEELVVVGVGVVVGVVVDVAVSHFVTPRPYPPPHRVIPQESKALGVGLELMFFDLLGSFPAPMLFGFIFDSSCAMWSRTCEGQRLTCRTYDNEHLRYRFFGMHIGCLALGSVLLIAGQRSVQKSHIELTTEDGESQQ